LHSFSDSGGASRLDRGHRNNGTNSSSRSEQARSCSRNSPGGGQQDNSVEDFDSLLKQVRAGLRKWYNACLEKKEKSHSTFTGCSSKVVKKLLRWVTL
jgi:hypothetical protein